MDKKVLIISLVITILLVILSVFFVWPSLGQVEEQSRKLSYVRDTISAFDKEAVEIEKFKQNYNNYLPNLQEMSRMFVEPDNLVGFIEFLEKSAEESEVYVEVQPQVSLQKEAKTAVFGLSCSGSLSGTVNFLEHLERGNYLINVTNFSAINSDANKVESDFIIEVLTR